MYIHFEDSNFRSDLSFSALQSHFECTLFVLRSSLHFSHCETGRPFFLISNRGRSLCPQEDERCPFIHDSLETCEMGKGTGVNGHTRHTSCHSRTPAAAVLEISTPAKRYEDMMRTDHADGACSVHTDSRAARCPYELALTLRGVLCVKLGVMAVRERTWGNRPWWYGPYQLALPGTHGIAFLMRQHLCLANEIGARGKPRFV